MPDDTFQWTLRGRCYKLGHDVPHPGGVIPLYYITAREMNPQVLVPHLFEETDPGFHERCRPGDIIVTGRNFGMGPKGNGYVAMQALGLGLLCESMSVQAYRAAISTGLRVLAHCRDITQHCETGDDIEIDYLTGRLINHTRNTEHVYAAVPQALRELLACGGNEGWLAHWWQSQGNDGAGQHPPLVA
jgi:3-isopropylmalate/(R)-2-methylmalate dehydratase small subunit